MNKMSYTVELNGKLYKVVFISLVGVNDRQSEVRLKFEGNGIKQIDVPAWWWWSKTHLPLKLATGSLIRRLTIEEEQDDG